MNGLHPIKMPSAKEKVAAELRKAILSRQLQEGEAVTLESVANQLEVSVMPVREAFQILARDGLIKLQRNKGAVVLGINETYIREHYQLRAILESAAAEMCCAPEVDITRIEESYECAAESIQNNDFAAYADQNREFHSEIWSAAGNSRMENMIAELWNGLSMGSMITEAEYAKVSIEEHERIMKAIRERNGAAAKEEMYRHIMRSRDDMLTNYRCEETGGRTGDVRKWHFRSFL